MNDYRKRIGTHVDGDDWRHWEFARRYNFPIDTDRGVNPDRVVFVVCAVLLVALLAAMAVGYI